MRATVLCCALVLAGAVATPALLAVWIVAVAVSAVEVTLAPERGRRGAA